MFFFYVAAGIALDFLRTPGQQVYVGERARVDTGERRRSLTAPDNAPRADRLSQVQQGRAPTTDHSAQNPVDFSL